LRRLCDLSLSIFYHRHLLVAQLHPANIDTCAGCFGKGAKANPLLSLLS
jgi:hypothetical protein